MTHSILKFAIALTLAALPVTTPAVAQDIVFDESLSQSCYYESGVVDGDGYPASDCVGVSANACQDATPDGSTTIGIGFCLRAEYAFWDEMLNEAYGTLRNRLKENDANRGDGAPSQVDALRDMQRAWITYRDAACAFERSLWANGSGASIGQISCLMNETAGQLFVLTTEIDMVGL